jgi:5S rRNA maturation endonuclease (ribonuclease M5)
MYGYNEHLDITFNDILGEISQEKIFEAILQEPFSFFSRYKSPFREDKFAGCRFEERGDGIILFIDFGSTRGKTHFNCFGLLMEIHGVTLEQAIRMVIDKFGLSSDKSFYKRPVEFAYNTGVNKSLYKNRDEVRQSLVKITYRRKEFNKQDIFYWSKFLIRKEDLVEDAVFPASYIYINNGYKQKKYGFAPKGLCYVMDFTDAVKVYQPLSKEYKWLSSCNENHIGNIDNLPETGDKLVICKAYKDHRIMRNLTGKNTYIWLQNEGSIPSTDILINLTERFKEIVIFYDNDMKGIESSGKLAQFLCQIKENIARTAVISTNTGYKDIGEIVAGEGRRDTLELIKLLDL